MLRLCIIGGSGHYRYVLEGLDTRVALVGHAAGSSGEDLGKLETMLQQHDIASPRFEDWQHMLDTVQPDIVVVNSHFGDHARLSSECLARGHHVLSEKPVATTLEDLAALQATEARSGRHFAAMFGIRGKPWFLTAHAAIAAGQIGSIRLLHAQKSYKLGQRPAFFAQRERSGGLIPWVGSHAIDWLQWLSGERFRRVSARHSRRDNQGNGDLEVSAQCLFELSNEVSASVSIDYLRPASAPTHDDDRIRIAGTGGIIEVRDSQVWLLDGESPQARSLPLLPARQLFTSFVDQVLGQGACLVSSEDAFRSTRASLVAREAADSGRTLDIED